MEVDCDDIVIVAGRLSDSCMVQSSPVSFLMACFTMYIASAGEPVKSQSISRLLIVNPSLSYVYKGTGILSQIIILEWNCGVYLYSASFSRKGRYGSISEYFSS